MRRSNSLLALARRRGVALPLGVASLLAAGGAATILAASGQAVGPVLSGAVSGDVSGTVSQTIILDPDLAVGANPIVVSGVTDWVSTRDDDGIHFTLAMEMNVGDRAVIDIFLENVSSKDVAATLSLVVPTDIDVALTEVPTSGTRVAEAQMARAKWLMRLAADTGDTNVDGIRLSVEPKDEFKPGFFTISGTIRQIDG